MQDAMAKSRETNKEAIDKAVLAIEKPENNVKQSFKGGQNGRSMPMPQPHLLSALFKKDNREPDDKSWLDRLTDSLVDRLELSWEDDEQARSDVRSPRFLSSLLPFFVVIH